MTATIARYHISLAQLRQQLLVVELAIKLIHLRDFGFQFLLITLRETTHDIQFLQLAFLLALHKLQDGVDAFLLGILDEATRIDNGDFTLRTLGVMDAMITIRLKLLHQQLAVNQVLGTAHRNYIYLVFLHFLVSNYSIIHSADDFTEYQHSESPILLED